MQVSRNLVSNTVNLTNEKQVSFNGNHLSQYYGQEAARLIAQNNKLTQVRPSIKTDTLKDFGKSILIALNPLNWIKAFIIDKKCLENVFRVNSLVKKGQKHAEIDKKVKRLMSRA